MKLPCVLMLMCFVMTGQCLAAEQQNPLTVTALDPGPSELAFVSGGKGGGNGIRPLTPKEKQDIKEGRSTIPTLATVKAAEDQQEYLSAEVEALTFAYEMLSDGKATLEQTAEVLEQKAELVAMIADVSEQLDAVEAELEAAMESPGEADLSMAAGGDLGAIGEAGDAGVAGIAGAEGETVAEEDGADDVRQDDSEAVFAQEFDLFALNEVVDNASSNASPNSSHT